MDSLVDPRTFEKKPSGNPSHGDERAKTFGKSMLIIAVFILAAGQYLPVSDVPGRTIFLIAAIAHLCVGGYFIGRSNRDK